MRSLRGMLSEVILPVDDGQADWRHDCKAREAKALAGRSSSSDRPALRILLIPAALIPMLIPSIWFLYKIYVTEPQENEPGLYAEASLRRPSRPQDGRLTQPQARLPLSAGSTVPTVHTGVTSPQC
mmetsp:Transcript_43585/g.100447  ORF Transcript_43585/g.100447 Transcript_43585/m.100447 type:complete len:126 (-) Transcript_43585:8-385(-)